MRKLGLGVMGLVLSGAMLVACETEDKSADGTYTAPADCPDPQPGALLFWAEPESVVPGQTMPLTPSVSSHPGSYEPLPSGCLKKLKVSPETAGKVQLDAYGDYELVISQTPPLGERVTVTGEYKGKNLRGRLTIYDPEQSPLVGYWRQPLEDCPEGTAIQELVFSADGTFSVTWEPFETYKDYWGRFSFDAETGTLELMPETGNNLPDGVQSGTVSLDEDRLTLGTASFGPRYEGEMECRAPFN